MQPGKLRNKIDIQTESQAQNDYGELTQAWSTTFSGVYASIEPIRGREYFDAGKVNAEVTTRIKIRYHLGVQPKMRVKHTVGTSTTYYDIIDVIDIELRHKEMHLMCREAVD